MYVGIVTSPYPGTAFKVQDGDVVVIRLPADASPDEAQRALDSVMTSIRALITERDAKIHVIACTNEYEITTLDEEDMRCLGWVRA